MKEEHAYPIILQGHNENIYILLVMIWILIN